MRVSTLRWVAMTAFAALFVTDYALDAWAKPVPDWAYAVLGAVSVGVEVPMIRDLLLAVVRKQAGIDDDKK